ncbi:hypothetical protein Tco_0198779 [Tanacetum coccineum]
MTVVIKLMRNGPYTDSIGHRVESVLRADIEQLMRAVPKTDHFPLPFMDQMLERLTGNQFYCFLDGFSGLFPDPIDPKDKRKDKRLYLPIRNTLPIVDMILGYAMQSWLLFGDSFSTCLSHLDKMLKRCEDTNLVLNWEKSHFQLISRWSGHLPLCEVFPYGTVELSQELRAKLQSKWFSSQATYFGGDILLMDIPEPPKHSLRTTEFRELGQA